ncbi:MAG: transposase [Nitrospirae bacterium]|nr:transposase [Nitrospirota bacterium]
MSRPLRIEFPGAYYHVMNRGLGRMQTFVTDEDAARFTELLEDVFRRWGVTTYAYCLMSNHYHVFLRTPRGNLSRVMRHVDGVYTQRFNRERGRDGPLFRGRYKAIVVDAEVYLLQLVRYIHLNPVEAGVVRSPVDYAWSSCRLYRMRSGASWLAREEVLSRFSSLPAFERFVAEGNEKSLHEFYRRRRYSPFLGREGFEAQVRSGIRPSDRHPRSERTPQFSNLGAVSDAVARALGVRREVLMNSRRGRLNPARNASIYVACRVAGFPHEEIKAYFGLGSDSAVTRACVAAEAMMKEDQSFFRTLSRLRDGT